MAASKFFIKNIKSLLGVHQSDVNILRGKKMNSLPALNDAWLAIEDGVIADFGAMSDWPGITDWRDLQVIDAAGRFVLPAWCDSHTHLVFAGSRSGEFVDRIRGFSYEEIAAKGGGILNSAKRLQSASENELFDSASMRLLGIMKKGTGAVEIKSGYGLSLESELKMLRVIRRLKESFPMEVKATFLGAHAFPEPFKNDPERYVDMLVNEMIPEIASQKLADFIDVFCEKNYFSVANTDRILEAGTKFGLRPKTHVNQFNAIGGVQVSINHNALSVDHLEVVDDDDIAALLNSETIPVALPGCSLFIKIPYTPARKIIDAGLPLALASDFNPGSAPNGNMNLVNSLACINMNMTPEEVINASTINGAYAMDVSHLLGSVTLGKKANLIFTHPMDSLADMMYYYGDMPVDCVMINGKIVSGNF